MINEKEYYKRKTVSNLKMLEKSKNEGNMKKETWFQEIVEIIWISLKI